MALRFLDHEVVFHVLDPVCELGLRDPSTPSACLFNNLRSARPRRARDIDDVEATWRKPPSG